MRSFVAAGALTALASTVSADLCSAGSSLVNGNWYCQAVQRIAYTGVGTAGSYNKITSMNSQTGACSSTPFAYSGSNAPLDEDVSLHFRGPFKLAQLAVYYPSGSSSKTKAKRSLAHRRQHGHAHLHQRHQENVERAASQSQEQVVEARDPDAAEKVEKRAVGDVVIATINGQVVSWINQYDGSSNAAATAVNVAAVPTAAAAKAPATTAAKATGTGQAYSAPSVAAGDWGRAGYYNSDSKTADGLTFINNMGGQGSGVFDYTFGNSLSYATADGKSGCAAPEVFGGSLASNNEIAIFSDQQCSGNSCGYVRDGTVAYHGFAGANKAFFLEFSMPDDGTSGWNMNMPAFWILNAQIPRTLQYGSAACSCWSTGCAEFDVFEVLDSGNTRCKSTLHGNTSGGDSDYFDRPTTSTIKAAVIFYADQIVIQLLDNSFEFPASISGSTIEGIMGDGNTVKTSVFKISK